MSRKLHQPALPAEEQRPLWMDREDRRQQDTQGGNSLRRKTEEGWTARDAASGKGHRRCCRRSWDRGTAAQKQRRGREKKQPLLEKNELSQENGFKREEMGQYTSDDRGQDGRHCEPKNMKS